MGALGCFRISSNHYRKFFTEITWYSPSREIETAVTKLNTEFIAKTWHWITAAELFYGLSISLVRTTPVAAAELHRLSFPLRETAREKNTQLFIPVSFKLT